LASSNEQPRIDHPRRAARQARLARHRVPSLRRHGRISLARLIEEHGADTGLPDLWESLAGDCQHARSTALNNRCAIYYPQLPALFLPGKGNLTPVGAAVALYRWRTRPLTHAFPGWKTARQTTRISADQNCAADEFSQPSLKKRMAAVGAYVQACLYRMRGAGRRFRVVSQFQCNSQYRQTIRSSVRHSVCLVIGASSQRRGTN